MRSILVVLLLLQSAVAFVPCAQAPVLKQHRVGIIPTRGAGAVTAVWQPLLPSVPALAAASFIPTCLGFWKTGYAVSYGYGGAMLASCLLMLESGVSGIARLHAFALGFYGLRLNLFLLYRELTLPVEVHQMQRRDATLAERLKRAPVVIGCSILYFLMAAPLRITARVPVLTQAPLAAAAATWSVALAFIGFGIAALGDQYKSVVKARKGPNHLVTGGPFKWLRHPNYTGEILGWTASFAAAVIAVTSNLASSAPPSWTDGWIRKLEYSSYTSVLQELSIVRFAIPWLVFAALGWVGIVLVLAGEATAGLEVKQKEKYGGTPEYEAWVASSWAGPMIGVAAESDDGAVEITQRPAAVVEQPPAVVEEPPAVVEAPPALVVAEVPEPPAVVEAPPAFVAEVPVAVVEAVGDDTGYEAVGTVSAGSLPMGFHRGLCAAGDDVYEADMTLEEARAYCDSNPECLGFTYNTVEQEPAGAVHIWFKSHLNLLDDESFGAWWTYSNGRDNV